MHKHSRQTRFYTARFSPSWEGPAGTHGPYERRRGRTGVRPAGIPFAVYHDQEYRERDVDVEAGVPVSGGAGHGNRVKFYELPGTDQVACVVHIGSYDTIGAAYGALMAWVDTNGYRIAGANREVYLIGPGMGTTPEGYVTEVQMPVEKV